MKPTEAPTPLPHDYRTACDYAIRHGLHTESQYLAIANHIRNHAPQPAPKVEVVGTPAPDYRAPERPVINVLIFGAGYDAAIYPFANPEGLNLMIEDRPEWIEIAKQLSLRSQNPLLIHGIDYTQPRVEPVVDSTEWEFIILDGRHEKHAFAFQCQTAQRLKRASAWVYCGGYEAPTLQAIVHETLGQPQGIIKSRKGQREKIFSVHPGVHRHPITKKWL